MSLEAGSRATLSRLRRALEEAFPDLDIREVTRLGEGWCNLALDVDGEWVFRFPGHDAAVSNQARERAVLPSLARRVPFRVPVPERFCASSSYWPRPFSGARRLPGTGLDVLAGRGLATPGLAASLGRCLRELHRVELEPEVVERLDCRSLPEWRDRYRFLGRRAREEVLPGLAEDLAGELRRRLARLDELLAEPAFELALLHGDLYPEHVLCDPDEEIVLGIVDWEDVMLGDPAMEASGLLDVLGPEFTEHVLEASGYRQDPGFRERLELYRQTLPLYPILFGRDTGDAAMASDGEAALARSLEGTG